MNILDHLYLLFPLCAAMVYAFGSMGFRAAAQDGGSPWQAMLLTNVLAGVLFQVYLKADPLPEPPADWLDVSLLGGVFFLGNVLTVLALSLGDVSIATPVLSAKVVMVVALVAFTGGGGVDLSTWLAGGLMVSGMVLLHVSGSRGQPHHHVTRTLFLALGAALCFAMFDVGVQFLSNRDGFHRVGPYAVGLSGILSLLLFPLANRRAPKRTAKGKRFLWIGAGLLSFQSLILIYALGHFNDAAGINIVYGSRGLWGVVMVSLAGKWFSNREREQSEGFFRYRVAGACCITGAIIWAMI